MPNLPAADVSCGACGTILQLEDEVLVCEKCGLAYDPHDLDAPAVFHDRHAPACADTDHPIPWSTRKPFSTVNHVVEVWRTWHHRYSPCTLPAGHTSDHHYPETTTFTEEEAASS